MKASNLTKYLTASAIAVLMATTAHISLAAKSTAPTKYNRLAIEATQSPKLKEEMKHVNKLIKEHASKKTIIKHVKHIKKHGGMSPKQANKAARPQ